MAILFVQSLSNNNNSRVLQIAVKTLEIILISAGLISTILMVKGTVLPYSCDFVFSSLIGIWNSVKCILSSPLYICIIINFMVILIAFSSSFHRHENLDIHDYHDIVSIPPPPPPPPCDVAEVTPPPLPPPTKDVVIPQPLQEVLQDKNFIEKAHEMIKRTTHIDILSMDMEMDKYSNKENEEMDNSDKDTIEDTCMDNYSDKENEEMDNSDKDTIEDTWNAITGGGKEKPKKKQLKKSETWNVQVPPRVQRLDSEELVPSTPKWKELRKLETFNDAVSVTRRGGLRRDPSVGIDEFNKQVDDFIKKFNNNMRLQRQESDQRFLQMVNQGL